LKPIQVILSRWQRKAIKKARMIVANTQHQLYGNALQVLGRGQCLCGMIPMVYNDYEFPTDSPWEWLGRHDFVIFNHSRQIWKSNPDRLADFDENLGNKRNDKTIRAFARFIRKTEFKNPILVLFEYGPDVDAAKSLIGELGIDKYVYWKGLSPRKDIMDGLKRANLAVDKVRKGLSGLGGTGFEAMASGVPLMTFSDGATSNPTHPFFKAPIIEVCNEEEILSKFIEYEDNRSRIQEIGKLAEDWFDRKLGIGLAKEYCSLLKILYEDRSFCHNSDQGLNTVEIREFLESYQSLNSNDFADQAG
jgi:glycosyltransferase involved in cell wall biosynthesis